VCVCVFAGVVTSFSVGSGLVFFREYQCVPTKNVAIMGCCMIGVIIGITILSTGKKNENEEEVQEIEGGEGSDTGTGTAVTQNTALGSVPESREV